MKVLKFGGTSVGTVESLRNVKSIVEGQTESVIVVVSALGGITDQLINTARLAAQGDISYLESYARIVDRHHKVIDGIVPEHSRLDVQSIVNPLLEELGNIYRGVNLIKDLSDRTLDIIVSYGERLSSVIISRIINGAIHLDSRNFIKTEKQWNKHVLDNDLTQKRVHEVFDELKFNVALVPGFIASDRDGNVTNLGRGGSDYTAAILAAALDASVLEIWTDVDGFMTADPRVINGALVIDHLSFTEAMELCNFGAKVIYPPTIYPVFHKNIPIWIKNTFNPSAPGTCISEQHPSPEGKAIKGISSINDTCLITVQGLGMVGVIGINSRIFNTLAKNGISVFLVSQAASENNTSFAVRNADADHAIEVLREQFAPELQAGSLSDIIAEPNLATVAIVGENMKHTTGIAGKLFNTLGRNGISVIACAQGASETNISFVIEHNNLRKALNVIHDSFFLSDTQVLNLFVVGIGNVGRNLLSQIHAQQANLLENKALRLRLVGIANSRKCVFDREGIDTENYNERLEASDIVATPENIRNGVIGMNIFNSVFVDCTSSPEIASLYADLLDHNVNVVAANKIAASGKYEDYERLKRITHKKDVKFLFETNVGAGLPIINTINNLINSGDRILKIEAVVSGTLNYIFNVLSREVPMSRAIKMAQEAGYSEPDPRTDLSGKDVIRKLVILAREAGYKVEQDDVEAHLFIPEKYFLGTIEDFYRNITEIDADFERQRAEAQDAGEHFRFVARLDNGVTSVGLQKVDSVHPFYHLEGSNNVILITTERYNEYPMVIKGYGAGAEVTAAGVFSDIIGIANIR
ncbi:bifunctional aspartate kinase/homoserine dehydrogenase I [Barnesiella sp. WM24]|uniref:bifunctional aspartate kinase/homoserine dehydrogenase I n=1 Tax=Barnesiella sp. WM24 TaxID=2558278 RepID=UPI001072B69B|nr:bifunctional aspartate kinase/homoserine dehydrogenase I [Barnesiella sp. WM24]TFU94721.1 bifunctional aspartate kinase/homoserine dehydrogenase I [Barnesiella sp. WM24]